MTPRQSLAPRCCAKPTRHPAHGDVDPHAVFKTQLSLRLKMIPVRHTGGGRRKRRNHRFWSYRRLHGSDALMPGCKFWCLHCKFWCKCTPVHLPGGPKPTNHPAHRYPYDDIDKDANDKNDPDGDVCNPKGKTNGFLIVFIDLGWSTFKDDQLQENNVDNDFQSEGKNQCFFNGFWGVMRFALNFNFHSMVTHFQKCL